MNKRLKKLRKILGLNQSAFGDVLGISQQSVGKIETGVNNLTDRNIDIICEKFNVNPEWLRTGEGEMFLPPPENPFLNSLAKEFEMTKQEIALIQSIIELPQDIRLAVIDFCLDVAKKVNAQAEERRSQTSRRREEIKNQMAKLQKELESLPVSDEELSRAEKHALLDAELDAQEKGRTSSVSTFSNGRTKNKV